MIHSELIERAALWLSGSLMCAPVLTENASTTERPDAIGWSSSYAKKHDGSIVVECKTSLSDFMADKAKYTRYEVPGHPGCYAGKRPGLLEAGYKPVEVGCMGDFRYFLCEPDVITPEHIEKHRPDHGLLYVKPRGIKVVIPAPRRTEKIDKASEIRLLRFALIHVKDNLLGLGCGVNMTKLTKFYGAEGITLPAPKQTQVGIGA